MNGRPMQLVVKVLNLRDFGSNISRYSLGTHGLLNPSNYYIKNTVMKH